MSDLHLPRRVLILGCGSVAQCLLPLLLEHFSLDPTSVTVLESRDSAGRIAEAIGRGVHYQRAQITPDNLDATLAAHLGDGDLLIDLAWNIDLTELLDWCRENNVRYLNTSVEVWDPYDDAATTPPHDRTLYVRHMALRRHDRPLGRQRRPLGGRRARRQPRPGVATSSSRRSSRSPRRSWPTGCSPTRHARSDDALAREAYNELARLST